LNEKSLIARSRVRARDRANVAVVVFLLCGCCLAPLSAGPLPEHPDFGDDLVVRKLAPGVWVHVTFTENRAGDRISANGLLVTTGEMSLLIDTGWNGDQTRRLLDWADGMLGQPVEHVIVTHSHPDRAGGLDAVLERPIIVHGHAGTAEIFRRSGRPRLHWSFEFEERLELGGEVIHLYYPGPGHAPDNIVAWLPRRKILFVGCLVRSATTEGLGYTGDANLEQWPSAVRRVIERYRDAKILVAGHGKPGGVELLSHTMELLDKAK
jgi:metallo-beta-lactamase class B